MPTFLDAERTAREELEPGEELVWVGKPIPGKVMGRSIVIFFFGLAFTIFSAFWLIEATAPLLHPRAPGSPATTMEIAFVFFGVPFVVIGLAFLSSPYWTYRAACQTVYAITSKRILIIKNFRTRHVRSISLQAPGKIVRRERADGTGDLIFITDSPGGPSQSDGPPLSFSGIANVREIENTIRKTFPEIAF